MPNLALERKKARPRFWFSMQAVVPLELDPSMASLERRLRSAASRGKLPEVQDLVAQGADVNHRDPADHDGWTALHRGLRFPAIVEVLTAERESLRRQAPARPRRPREQVRAARGVAPREQVRVAAPGRRRAPRRALLVP
jgi:hypothetical protein